MPKEDVYVMGFPSRMIYTEEEVRAMPVLSTSNKWERRDTGDPRLRVETFLKKNGHLRISVATNAQLDGKGEWLYYGDYSSERVQVAPDGTRSLHTKK